MNHIYPDLLQKKKAGIKSFAVLLDPDKITPEEAAELAKRAKKEEVDYLFVGGSLLTSFAISSLIAALKSACSIPVIIFPGSNLQISEKADAILFLSLISGRNPEYLIGQHVTAAPLLKDTGLEVIPTGYMLVDCGNATTVSYISNTTPIPYDKPGIAGCTALAGEMLGLKLIYLDGGSGAGKPISGDMIKTVRQTVDLPLIVGGGINSPEKAEQALSSGADLIVVGTGIEKDQKLLNAIAQKIKKRT